MTRWGTAFRRWLPPLVLALSSTRLVAAESATPVSPSFDATASQAIAQVYGAAGYTVEPSRPDPRTGKMQPILLGQTLDPAKSGDAGAPLIRLECSTMGAWEVIGSDRGERVTLVAALCDRKSELSPELLASAARARDQMFAFATKTWPKDVLSTYWRLEPERDTLNRFSSEYLETLLFSHGGIGSARTLTVDAAGSRRALVLQLGGNACDFKSPTPLCRSQKDSMQRIAVQIAQDFPLD